MAENINNIENNNVENGVWYLDYTAHNPTSIPDGVNTVNLFVSGLDGQLEGFTPESLRAFVNACHAKGIHVKMSIGGQGGKYDKCWDELNGQNTSQIAKRLIDFCNNYKLDGIDFDYEENQEGGTLQQEQYVGQLIKSFKDQAPDLTASLCTPAGDFWQSAAKAILDQTKDSSGASVIDHLYMMSYAGTTQQVESWADHWDSFLDQYKLPPSAVTIGIAENHGPGYDPDEIAKYAASKGYSTMIWNYNPTTPDSSNAFAKEIHDDYYGK